MKENIMASVVISYANGDVIRVEADDAQEVDLILESVSNNYAPITEPEAVEEPTGLADWERELLDAAEAQQTPPYWDTPIGVAHPVVSDVDEADLLGLAAVLGLLGGNVIDVQHLV